MTDPIDARRRRLLYRASHRGTREADFMIGGFCARYATTWDEADIGLFETLLEETDVDIMAWAIGTASAPAHYRGPLLEAMQRLDFMDPAR